MGEIRIVSRGKTHGFLTYETEFVLFLAVLENKYLSWMYGKLCHQGH